MNNHIIAGGLSGIVGGITGKQVENLSKAYFDEYGPDIHKDIKDVLGCLQYICHCQEDLILKPVYDTVVLQPGYFISMNNEKYHRAYNMALVTSSTQVQFKVPELGAAFTLTLQAGWNILNMPDYTQWALPSAASSNVTLRYCAGNHVFGNAI